MSRRPKPTETLKLHGTYRADRHAGRMDARPPSGSPCRPDLGQVGGSMWDQVIAEHTSRGTLGELDTASLVTLCRTLELLETTHEVLKIDPTDKDTRCAYAAYVAICDKLGAKFGWTPSDRAALKLGEQKPQSTIP